MNRASCSPLDLRRCGPVLAAVAALSVIVIITFYPGVMTPDSETTLRQARSLELTDWHPPIMALVWRYLDAIIRGQLLMLVAQALLYAWAVAKLCVEGLPALSRRLPVWALILIFGLFPPAMALTGMIWKDVWTSGFLLLGLGYLYAMADSGAAAKRRYNLGVLILCCALATAFRHNAVSATAGLLAGGCYFLIPDRMRELLRLFLACCGGVILALALWAANGVFIRAVTTPSHPTTSILLHDIAGTIVNSDQPEVEAAYLLDHYPTVSSLPHDEFMLVLHRAYQPGGANSILRSSRRKNVPYDLVVYDPNHDASAVKSAWRDLVSRNPGAYLAHRTGAFRCMLQFCDIDRWAYRSYVLNPNYLGTESSSAAQARLRHTLLHPGLVRLYSPAPWLAICVAVGLAALFFGKGRNKIPFFMGLSSFGLAFALFFTVPTESYRYMHWTILLGWAAVFIVIEAAISRHSDPAPRSTTPAAPR